MQASDTTLLEMIRELPEQERNQAIVFIKRLKNKVTKERVNLKGIIKGITISDEQINEAKNIWQLP